MGKRFFFLILYSLGMAYVEAMVVVYLRGLVHQEIWLGVRNYSELVNLISDSGIMWTEQTRELATIVMLVGVAYLFGRNLKEKWAAFLISFGIWDIFYYVFLFLWLRWPDNLLTMDVLFLIPVPWVAPVIVPVVISCVMIGFGVKLLKNSAPERVAGRS